MLDATRIEMESLSCNNCGAPLNVPQTANFVTCNHCQTQLAIRRTPTALYTERLAEMSRRTEELTAQVKHHWPPHFRSLSPAIALL